MTLSTAFRQLAHIMRHSADRHGPCIALEFAWHWRNIDTPTLHAMMQRVYDHPGYPDWFHRAPREDVALWCESMEELHRPKGTGQAI